MLFGTAISAIGFFALLIFYSTEKMVSIGLTILAAGLSLSITGAFNLILLSANADDWDCIGNDIGNDSASQPGWDVSGPGYLRRLPGGI